VYVVQRSSDGVTILAIVLIIIFVIIPLVLVLVFLGLLGAACSAATGAFVPAVWLASRRSRICRQALAQALARP
jgi:TRAP-type mannitol/chloroaromatic compound transport system permease large subunit